MRTLILSFVLLLNCLISPYLIGGMNLRTNNYVLYIDVDELPKFQSTKYKTVMEYLYCNVKYPYHIDVR